MPSANAIASNVIPVPISRGRRVIVDGSIARTSIATGGGDGMPTSGEVTTARSCPSSAMREIVLELSHFRKSSGHAPISEAHERPEANACGILRGMPRILGQNRALEMLDAALASGRFHHGWIFSGPKGVGKFTTALELARVLLDPEQAGLKGLPSVGEIPDPHSRVQRLIDSRTHPDLHIIRKEMALYSDNRDLRERKLLNIPLDLLRERVLGGKSGETMHEAAAYRTPALGAGKVFIIDEAELLAREAQNAMLKTLEEPPANTWFFLITSLPDRLLPTIHSRCQHVRFARLDERAMAEWWKIEIARKCDDGESDDKSRKKKDSFDPKEVSAATVKWSQAFSEGSPGVALLAMEYGFHDWFKALEPMLQELDRGVFPASMGELLGTIVEEFAVAWVKRHGEKETSKDAANKDGARHVLSLLGAHARQRLANTVGNEDTAERWATAIDLLRECERQIESNVNQKLAMDNLAAQWTAAIAGSLVA